MPGEPALRLPPLAVHPPVPRPPRFLAEPLDHLPRVLGLRPLPPGVAAVQREHRGPDAEAIPTEGVVVPGVVAGVPEQGVDRAPGVGRPDGRLVLRRVLGRAAGDVGGQVQVGGRVLDGSRLGPPPLAAALPGPPREVPAGVPGLEPGGVDGRPRLGRDQLAGPGGGDDRPEEGIDPPLPAAAGPPSGGSSGPAPGSARRPAGGRTRPGGTAPAPGSRSSGTPGRPGGQTTGAGCRSSSSTGTSTPAGHPGPRPTPAWRAGPATWSSDGC